MSVYVVTGATGFIGWTVTRKLLSMGHDVRCPVRNAEKAKLLAEEGAQVREIDYDDEAALVCVMKGADHVIHLAGATKARTRQLFWQANEGLVEKVLTACSHLDSSPVVILVSSVAASGPSLPHAPRSEAEVPQPVSEYGRSKLAGERLGAKFAATVPVSIVRPGIVFGGDDRLTLEMFKSIRLFRTHVSAGWKKRQFSLIFSDELTDLLIAISHSGERLPAPGTSGDKSGYGIYNACRPESPTFPELGLLVAKSMGLRRVLNVRLFQPLPQLVGWSGDCFSWLTGKPAFLNSDKIRESLADSWIFDGAKAAGQFGFEPEIPLLEKFEEVTLGYRKKGWL